VVFFGAGEKDEVEFQGPSLEFVGPVLQGEFGNNNEMWTRISDV
jgi:hypothetical protein